MITKGLSGSENLCFFSGFIQGGWERRGRDSPGQRSERQQLESHGWGKFSD